ncbi:MAG TPA: DUF1800 domain-containing protein [Vicinamibacterales bacterium]|nr:DUF1800 domain-containing protein [Vicinamibacterales bacterium]
MAARIAQVLLSLAVFVSLPSDPRAISHVLERTSFGLRPGDVERVQAQGLERYIEEQLHPERLSDAGLDARLSDFDTLRMSSRDIAQQFEMPLEDARKAAGAAAGDGKPSPEQRRAATVVQELQEQKVLRAIYSGRQLQEVLVDFWFNHFNVDARKGASRFLLTSYERDVIRPHVFGRFRDLLEATAKSPAMLFYLDNWQSVDPNGVHVDAPRGHFVRGPFGQPVFVQPPLRAPRQNANAPKGLNENYGRELMELHTLGVDGGYTQQDVTEVARAFTGWTIERPRQDGTFKFDPRLHDDGRKLVLGHVINAGGMNDGEQVLDLLARHPSTARFIATKLVRHFVSDTPPPSLVDRVAARFRETDGDLREVMRTLLLSPEFLSPDVYRQKIKTPFEFVVSAVRATGAEVHDARPLVNQIAQLGEPLYQCQPPTGYKDTADAWVNTGALVGRMNFGLALAGNRLRGIVVSNPTPDGIQLGAPEFQRR